jgi:hypothetical protein
MKAHCHIITPLDRIQDVVLVPVSNLAPKWVLEL